MTREDIHQCFVLFMERSRSEHDMTITEMAAYLGISTERYKNIIYGKTECIDIYLACRIHDLTGAWMWEMCGYATTDSEVINQYVHLNHTNRKVIRDIARVLESHQQGEVV